MLQIEDGDGCSGRSACARSGGAALSVAVSLVAGSGTDAQLPRRSRGCLCKGQAPNRQTSRHLTAHRRKQLVFAVCFRLCCAAGAAFTFPQSSVIINHRPCKEGTTWSSAKHLVEILVESARCPRPFQRGFRMACLIFFIYFFFFCSCSCTGVPT